MKHSASRGSVVGIALALALILAACGKVTTVVEETKIPTEPAPCDVEVENLRAYLGDLVADGIVPAEFVVSREDPFRYLSRPLPIVPLLRRDDQPQPMMHAAMISLHRGQARFGDDAASVSNVPELARVLAKAGTTGLSPGFGFGGSGGFVMTQPVIVFVSERERWGDVTTLFRRLESEGYAQLELPFAVKAHAAPPADSAEYRRMLAIASDAKEMPWKIDVALAKELKARNPACPAVASPFLLDAHDSAVTEMQRNEFMKETPAAVRACSCKADLDAIRSFAWVKFGRHWGTPTVTYEVALSNANTYEGSDAAVKTISAAADTPWRDMAETVVAAAKNRTPTRFAIR